MVGLSVVGLSDVGMKVVGLRVGAEDVGLSLGEGVSDAGAGDGLKAKIRPSSAINEAKGISPPTECIPQ
jgi:hypothetical protein